MLRDIGTTTADGTRLTWTLTVYFRLHRLAHRRRDGPQELAEHGAVAVAHPPRRDAFETVRERHEARLPQRLRSGHITSSNAGLISVLTWTLLPWQFRMIYGSEQSCSTKVQLSQPHLSSSPLNTVYQEHAAKIVFP